MPDPGCTLQGNQPNQAWSPGRSDNPVLLLHGALPARQQQERRSGGCCSQARDHLRRPGPRPVRRGLPRPQVRRARARQPRARRARTTRAGAQRQRHLRPPHLRAAATRPPRWSHGRRTMIYDGRFRPSSFGVMIWTSGPTCCAHPNDSRPCCRSRTIPTPSTQVFCGSTVLVRDADMALNLRTYRPPPAVGRPLRTGGRVRGPRFPRQLVDAQRAGTRPSMAQAAFVRLLS